VICFVDNFRDSPRAYFFFRILYSLFNFCFSVEFQYGIADLAVKAVQQFKNQLDEYFGGLTFYNPDRMGAVVAPFRKFLKDSRNPKSKICVKISERYDFLFCFSPN
jgi:hypothetical protein